MEQSGFEGALSGLATRVGELFDDSTATQILDVVRGRAPDERLALAFLLQLAERSQETLMGVVQDSERAADLVRCLGGSEVIGTGLSTIDDWVPLFDRARRGDPLVEPIIIDTVTSLGDFKRRTFLTIAIGDLLGRLNVGQTVAAMSRLAERCTQAALAIAIQETDSVAIADRFCVLGLGKLGASELNLSSDIDLVYLFDDRGDRTEQETARRLGEKLTEIIAAHCFRIDLRLRPGGRSAPLVSTVDGALGFYQAYGETWERAALLRARPIAGAIDLGERLLSELQRFVYRVYLDFETIDQLRAMKRQIEDELRSPDLIERNIKLGRGGIRELEFVVQALVLIYGGRDPRLRTSQTTAALERFATYGYMAESQARALAEAYLFLRNVEHKLQVAAGLQTHTLPTDGQSFAVLATRLGYNKSEGSERLREDLARCRQLVADQFREMLSGDGETPGGGQLLPQAVWRVAAEPEWSVTALAELGFAHPKESARHLELLVRGPAHLAPSQRRRESLERLGPLLIDEISHLPNPDLGLCNLAQFMTAVGARSSFLALLAQHPATRRVLLRLFSSSAYLSEVFIRHPEMIDTLVRSDLARVRRPESELAAELHGLLQACSDFESRLDALRSFSHQEFLRIAIADLADELELEDVQAELTLVAETTVREALRLAREEVARRYAVPSALKLCVLALGRLGSIEMTYNSDLDLIFVYYLPAEVAAGEREMAARIAQKFIAILEAPTREGFAYKIDLRLRPSGNAGPLVTSLEGFHQYHNESSALWERQALVRGRVVAGDRVLGDEVEAARQKFVFGRGLDAHGVGEIAAMYARIEHELGHETPMQLNLKQGAGGLVQVEFVSQILALRYGLTNPLMRQRSTSALLQATNDCGLMPPEEIAQLKDDYHFIAELENRLRIETGRPVSSLPTAPNELAPLARRAGYQGASAAQDLLQDLAVGRARIRTAFANCIAREQSH